MATLPNMGLNTPTVGGSSGAWGTTLNADLVTIDGHRHIPGEGALVPSAGLNIDADLTFAGFSPTNVRALAFAAGQAVTGTRRIYVGADGELYWNTNGAGTAVKLTNGTALNVAAFVGGIGGDYSALSAAFNYDDSQARYTARKGGGTTWARIASGELRIHEHNTTASTYVALASPAALASSYTLTLPAALPGSTQIAQISSAGAVTASNTIANAVTCSALVTANAGVTCGANQHVTVSGTGRFKHGSMIMHVPVMTGTGTGWSWDATNGYLASTGAGTWSVGVPTIVGWRVESLTFERYGDGSADLTGGILRRQKNATPSTLFGISVTNPPASYVDEVCNIADIDIVDGDSLFVNFTANAANLRIGELRVTYSMP